jgi:ATP-dependent DNA helicase RecG
MDTHMPLEAIKGVGDKTSEQLSSAGLHTVNDLIMFLPRGYEDYSRIVKIKDITPGKQTIKARCETVSTKRVRRGMTITTAVLVDPTGKLQAVWFNQPYRATQLRSADEFFFSGEFEFSYNRYQMTNPSAEKVSDMPISSDRIVPMYKSIKGLKSQVLRKILIELKPLISQLPETLPEDLITQEKLVSFPDALLAVHFPMSLEDIKKGRERLGFEEVFHLLLAAQINKQSHLKLSGWPIAFDQAVIKHFVAQLPFKLTDAQRLAAWEIIQDFEKLTPMNRLLQGDVGSGKTVVAGLAARQAALSGLQTAFMAPTEILAGQHAETLRGLLDPLGLRVGLLTGSVKGKVRLALQKQIAIGGVDIIVGTHALIQQGLTFHKLGFVVIDEQHRFGVAQRQELLKKSKHMPHLLSMTATPIPRSLALTLYGELDISILNERPKGRLPIITKIWSPNSREQLYKNMDQEISSGRQAYVICNLIDDNELNELKSVQEEYKKLRVGPFKHRAIGLLHGKMKSKEKDEVMQDFSSGKIDILVSTTVVEVGVDVPNATVMMIENADRFGLAQLHQLRGRVGRSSHQSYCYLVMSDSKAPSKRLKEIEKSNDGFYLAEVDLQLRGPGEIYGRSQHGELNLQVASLSDTNTISRAQRAALSFVQSGKDLLQYKHLAAKVEKYQRLTKLN